MKVGPHHFARDVDCFRVVAHRRRSCRCSSPPFVSGLVVTIGSHCWLRSACRGCRDCVRTAGHCGWVQGGHDGCRGGSRLGALLVGRLCSDSHLRGRGGLAFE